MANNTLSLNQIVAIFRDLAVRSKMISDFGNGPTYDLNAKVNTKYPLLWVEQTQNKSKYNSANTGYREFTYGFNLYVLDRVNKGDDNYLELLSDCQYSLSTIIAEMEQHRFYIDNNFSIVEDILFTPVQYEYDDNVNGYMASIKIKVPLRYTPCNNPIEPITGYTVSLNTSIVEYRLAGNQGPMGFQGATSGIVGPMGNQGFQGNQGWQGWQGVIGFQGSTGSQGFQGITGSVTINITTYGATGAQGNQGFQGSGITGSIGSQGYQGFQGITGSVIINVNAYGVTGSQGYQGNIGSQGYQGWQGNQGNIGIGSQGATGSQGYQGITGSVIINVTSFGATGNQGPQGISGPQGLIGATGSSISSITASTGLRDTNGIWTANISTGISGTQSIIGSTSSANGLVIKATTASASSVGGNIIFQTGNNGDMEAMRIDSQGRVMIGTKVASSQLTVRGIGIDVDSTGSGSSNKIIGDTNTIIGESIGPTQTNIYMEGHNLSPVIMYNSPIGGHLFQSGKIGVGNVSIPGYGLDLQTSGPQQANFESTDDEAYVRIAGTTVVGLLIHQLDSVDVAFLGFDGGMLRLISQTGKGIHIGTTSSILIDKDGKYKVIVDTKDFNVITDNYPDGLFNVNDGGVVYVGDWNGNVNQTNIEIGDSVSRINHSADSHNFYGGTLSISTRFNLIGLTANDLQNRLLGIINSTGQVGNIIIGTGLTLSSGILSSLSITGSQGFQGFQGSAGSTGSNGNQGFQGNQGNQGLIGITGSQGFQGNVGSSGAQGNQGFQGWQGYQGLIGVTGSQGWQGSVGSVGSQGNQGLQGITGSQGFQGWQGRQGFQGIQGITGSQGNQGNQGLQGFQGWQGIISSTGSQGFQGLQGPAGSSGTGSDSSLGTTDNALKIVGTALSMNKTYYTISPTSPTFSVTASLGYNIGFTLPNNGATMSIVGMQDGDYITVEVTQGATGGANLILPGGTTASLNFGGTQTTTLVGYYRNNSYNWVNNVTYPPIILGQDFTTSSTSAVDITGAAGKMQFPIGANEAYAVRFVGRCKKATSATGLKFAINGPSGCVVTGMQYGGAATTRASLVPELINNIATLGGTMSNGTNITVGVVLEFRVLNSTTPGYITMQVATVTSNVATVFAGTMLQYQKGILV